ncbi:putative nuclear migration protein [Aspergillus saccharolyticus JOP 1030-1]|uniref:Nuclear migration protein n=1 Tax=Aspergillus saccharolyticus JOP 1030-1 TaxID=1450539 RepID=A0A318Z3K3_9EURO|nr:nuclear migration protein [Aspergillus saccharolyticus JOP 1030-1]PYH41865.1 nuclear migration protein [Aspergillus saccharolyticus JOP 1030-1]
MTTNSAYTSSPVTESFPTPTSTRPRAPPIRLQLHSPDSDLSPFSSLPVYQFSPPVLSDYDDILEEDNPSPLDSRQFTPTLHASLVSEILSLRRDVESKLRTIESLEHSLDESRIENESLNERLSKSLKDSRSLKQQLQLLEGGSSSAISELAQERDQALEHIADARKKLEQAQRKARSSEEETERTVQLWNRDKDTWDQQRRNLERKVHVVEGRLKTVLNEVAAAQEARSFHSTQNSERIEGTDERLTEKESDAANISSSSEGRRRISVTSVSTDHWDEFDYHNVRYSMASVSKVPVSKGEGLNLAQELAFDDDDDDDFRTFDHGFRPDSPEALPEERPVSVHSQLSSTMGMGAKARKILGLSLGNMDGYSAKNESASESDSPLKLSAASFMYRDAGVQYSLLLSPTLNHSHVIDFPSNETNSKESPCSCQAKVSSASKLTIDMVSASCQTVAGLPTPPWTPDLDNAQRPKPVVMVSSSMQTVEFPQAEPAEQQISMFLGDTGSPGLEIPMIAIHPPCSEPPSPRGSVVLPPQTKSVACQATLGSGVVCRAIGVQTEEIKGIQRPVKLAATLLPSAIPDLPLCNVNADFPIQPYCPPPARLKNMESTTTQRSNPLETVQAYPGNNDNGPLAEGSDSSLRRPHRSSSLFAGFEQGSDDESHDKVNEVLTDDDFLNRPFASYTLKRGKLVSTQGGSCSNAGVLAEIDEHISESKARSPEVMPDCELRDRLGSAWSQQADQGLRRQNLLKEVTVSHEITAHQMSRSRSPSEPSVDHGNTSKIAPPIPVPIRHSSRKFPARRNDSQQSPTSSHPRTFSDRGHAQMMRRPTLRRVRSAAAMAQTEQPESRSSPTSTSSCSPDSSRYSVLPYDGIPAPCEGQPVQRRSAFAPTVSHTFAHERQDSKATSVQPTSVVDAIAQTMVGEWMYKYIRRRRSFGGIGESKEGWEGRSAEEVSANITNSGVRHKRWVWLAPYERAVMWSSKQPTSGHALLGKSGRKLMIQSVLDVRDDNPLPKGTNAQSQFNRSILILTPQRALKFTVTSIERHYVWLTALSFLSHSPMGIHDLAALPPVPQDEGIASAPSPALRRNPIRDSIRVAKGRPRPRPKGKRSFLGQVEPVPELPYGFDSSPSMDAADPPTVPRFSNHSRKRSNTTPRISTIRSFSIQGSIPSIESTRGSSDTYGVQPYGPGTVSGRTSETSARTGNFFDAIGTVRMEAFIDQANKTRAHQTGRHSRKTSGAWSATHNPNFPHGAGAESNHRVDPFAGF